MPLYIELIGTLSCHILSTRLFARCLPSMYTQKRTKDFSKELDDLHKYS